MHVFFDEGGIINGGEWSVRTVNRQWKGGKVGEWTVGCVGLFNRNPTDNSPCHNNIILSCTFHFTIFYNTIPKEKNNHNKV